MADQDATYKLISPHCPSKDGYTLQLFITSMEMISLATMTYLGASILYRRRKDPSRTITITITWLYEYLVTYVCIWGCGYYFFSTLHSLNCKSPSLFVKLSNQVPTVLYHWKYIIFAYPQDVCALMGIFWHSNLAYSLHGFICKKQSPSRLYDPRRIWLLLLLATTLVTVRYLLAQIIGIKGLMIAASLFDFVIIPITLICLIHYYFSAFRALHRQRHHFRPHASSLVKGRERSVEVPPTMQSEGEEEGADQRKGRDEENGLDRGRKGGALSDLMAQKKENPTNNDAGLLRQQQQQQQQQQYPSPLHFGKGHDEDGGGNVNGGSYDNETSSMPQGNTSVIGPKASTLSRTTSQIMHDPGNQDLIRRLMRVVCFVACAWTVTMLIDIYSIYDYSIAREPPNLMLLFVRYAISSIQGFFETLFIGYDMNCFHERPKPARLARPMFLRSDSSFSNVVYKSASGFIRRASSLIKHPSLTSFSSMDNIASHISIEMINLEDEQALINEQKVASSASEGKLHVFATTYNTGGITEEMALSVLPRLLEYWIPAGYDLYVVGVQECQFLPVFRYLLHKHLGGPDHYRMYGSEIGDSTILHGQIGLTIFVRAADVTQGFVIIHEANIQKIATGVGLGPMGALPNKGMTGLSVLYHDITLAFVTSHFASDKKGRNRLSRRNQDACTSLRDLSLHWETTGIFDVHHQHTHTFVLGDFNYRLTAPPSEVLDLVSQSAQLCQTQISPSPPSLSKQKEKKNWRSIKYARLFDLPTSAASVTAHIATAYPTPAPPLHATTSSMSSLLTAGDSANDLTVTTMNPWLWVNNLDELHRSQRDGYVFYNFREGEINFPPSYRWHRCYPFAKKEDSSHLTEWGEEEEGDEEEEEEGMEGEKKEEGGSLSPPLDVAGSLAGDFTDLDTLWSAYTTSIDGSTHHRPAEQSGRSAINSILMRESSNTSSIDSYIGTEGGGGGSAASSQQPHPPALISATTSMFPTFVSFNSQRTPMSMVTSSMINPSSSSLSSTSSSLRTPSYTDRILTHSLPCRAAQLQWLAYDMMDLIQLSDHRPVCAAFEVTVDKSVREFNRFYDDGEGAVQDDLMIFTFTIGNPQYQPHHPKHLFPELSEAKDEDEEEFDEERGGRGGLEMRIEKSGVKLAKERSNVDSSRHSDRSTGSSSKGAPQEVTLVFPLVSEDSVYQERVASALTEAIPSFNQPGKVFDGRSKLTSSSIRGIRWTDFPSKFQIIASKHFSQHMLIKVSDGKGQDMGQAIFPISVGMREKAVTISSTATNPATPSMGKSNTENSTVLDDEPSLSISSSLGNMVRSNSVRLSFTRQQQQQQQQQTKKQSPVRLTLPVASGGALKGYLAFDFKVKMTPLEPN